VTNNFGTSWHGGPVRGARRLAAALTAALAGSLIAAAPVAAAAGNSFSGFLNDVTCVAAADCWAFGQDSAQHAVAEHWNGSAWGMVPVAGPAGARSTYLPSVSCVSAADCWAVGQYQQATGKMLAFAEHWNGTAWSPAAAPAPSGSLVSLLISVSCAGAASCWAVGSGLPSTFMERWNGHAWAAVLTPGLGSGANPERVACISATDCWLSGIHGNGSTGGTLIGHWTGKAWTAVRTPTSHIPADGLLGISCQPAACVAVGSRGNTHPLAQRWTGSAWAVTPTGSAAAVLYGVACVSPRDCMAVGGTRGGNGQVFGERWSGSRWRAVPAQSPRGAVTASLVGAACVHAADCWGAGSWVHGSAGRGLIEHWNGTSWSVTVS
jgi:hypothetical protein